MNDGGRNPGAGRSKWLRVAAINLILIANVLILTEIIFGGWIFGTNFGLLVIPKNFTRQYDVSGLYGGGKTLYRRDKVGLRGDYDDPARIDILTIGGSTTNEIFITEGKTWSDVLAAQFRAGGKRLSVVNGGVDGQSTFGHLLNFDIWYPKIAGLKARYMLVYVGLNDLARMEDENYESKQDRLIEQRRPFKRFLLNNSAVYGLFRNIRGIYRARAANLIHNTNGYPDAEWRAPTPPPDLAAAETKLAKALTAYDFRLRQLARRITAFGAKPIFVSQPDAGFRLEDGKVLGRLTGAGGIDTGKYAELAAVARRTMKSCKDAGAICIDLFTELRFGQGDHYDNLHTTPQGSAKIGRYLYSRLKDVID